MTTATQSVMFAEGKIMQPQPCHESTSSEVSINVNNMEGALRSMINYQFTIWTSVFLTSSKTKYGYFFWGGVILKGVNVAEFPFRE